jgi:MoaA/NifB/PqqE/SkfB family radical SAM enzyme
MSVDDWRTVIGDAATLGITGVQFIGGEPTLHPGFPQLLERATQTGLKAEVFTNLVHVDAGCWSLYQHPNVSLATSYYSDLAAEHEKVTGRRGSHARTRANIAQAERLGYHPLDNAEHWAAQLDPTTAGADDPDDGLQGGAYTRRQPPDQAG